MYAHIYVSVFVRVYVACISISECVVYVCV